MAYDVVGIYGFDAGMHNNAGGYADHFYTGWGYRSESAAYTGPYGFADAGETSNSWRILFPQAYSDVVIGYRAYMRSNFGNAAIYKFRFLDSSGGQMAAWWVDDLMWTADDETRIYDSTGTYSGFAHDVWGASRRDKWIFIEHYFSARLNTWQIRVDEEHVWTWDKDYNNLGTDILYFDHGNDALGELWIDDVYALGSNDQQPPFWGDTKVYSIPATANGQYSEWWGGDGDQVDNYLNVDQATPDMNAEHNFTPHPNAKDTYVFEDMPALGLGHRVRAVQCDLWGNYTGGPDFTADAQALVYDPGATPVPVPSPTTYTFNDNIDVGGYAMAANPATGLEWTEDDVNDSEFGFEYLGENP